MDNKEVKIEGLKKPPLRLFGPSELKKLGNRIFFENMEKAVLDYFKTAGVEVTKAQASVYASPPGEMITNRFWRKVNLSYEEPDGILLEFHCFGIFEEIPTWIYELILRLRSNSWPKEFTLEDYSMFPWEYGDENPDLSACWHHTGISWHTGYFNGKPGTHFRLEMGYCYCS